jgi:plastocyanin
VSVVHGRHTFRITNRASIVHNWRIRRGTAGVILARSRNLGPNGTQSIAATLSAGSYTMFCSIHAGMRTSFRAT